jgi:hypothetical protein
MTSNRREFLRTASGALLTAAGANHLRADQSPRAAAPYRLLYSNDLTNITSCVSPFRRAGETFRPEMLEATVDEVAGTGVDAHLLQPGLGTVPLWPSRSYPLDAHVAWLADRYGVKPDSFTRSVIEGGDLVKTFIDRCRLRGQAPLLSIRMNDIHHKEYAEAKKGDKLSTSLAMSLNRFYVEHPEYRIRPDGTSSKDRALNWAVPAVRDEKLALLTELCELYDFDGLELDFLRFYSFFRPEETKSDERAEIMTAFVRDVRAALDRTARGDRRRRLSIRVPCYLEALDQLGLDLAALTAVGVDMVNASAHYFTTQRHHLAAIRRRIPESKSLYFELCHTIWKGDKVQAGYDVFPFRRATPEQLHTAAHLAYAHGADGISLFNFPYYRPHGQGEGRGTFGEPPFDALAALADPAALAGKPHHWFLAPDWRAPGTKPLPVPRRIEAAKAAEFVLDLAPPHGGWKTDARLRIQCNAPLGDDAFRAELNGTPLTATPDASEPFAVAYPSMLGKPEELRAWIVPAGLLTDGINRLKLTPAPGVAANVGYLDLATK